MQSGVVDEAAVATVAVVHGECVVVVVVVVVVVWCMRLHYL